MKILKRKSSSKKMTMKSNLIKKQMNSKFLNPSQRMKMKMMQNWMKKIAYRAQRKNRKRVENLRPYHNQYLALIQ